MISSTYEQYKQYESFIPFDEEWSYDWNKIRSLFIKIGEIKKIFNSIDSSFLRKVIEFRLLLQLEKYIETLQYYIINKYS